MAGVVRAQSAWRACSREWTGRRPVYDSLPPRLPRNARPHNRPMAEHKILSRGIFIGMALVRARATGQHGVGEYRYQQSAANRDRSMGYADTRLALENAMRN